MRKEAVLVLCALLAGCSSPKFTKLDSAGQVDPALNPETLQRDLADCEVTATQVRSENGPLLARSAAKAALDNCMRSKGYVRG
jgi:hypothetical protein